jgi:hypothetical protein
MVYRGPKKNSGWRLAIAPNKRSGSAGFFVETNKQRAFCATQTPNKKTKEKDRTHPNPPTPLFAPPPDHWASLVLP